MDLIDKQNSHVGQLMQHKDSYNKVTDQQVLNKDLLLPSQF